MRMKFILLSLSSFVLLNLSCASNASALEVNVSKSMLEWIGKKGPTKEIVIGKHSGEIKFKSGKINTDKNGKIIGGEFVVDMNSMTVKDLSGADKEKFLKHMKSSDFFSVSEFPTAQLIVKKVENNVASGELTIKGKTEAISFEFKGDKGHYSGKLVFDRTKFGITFASGTLLEKLGDKTIFDDVEVQFHVMTN